MEPKESALARELLQELGVDVQNMAVVDIFVVKKGGVLIPVAFPIFHHEKCLPDQQGEEASSSSFAVHP